MTEFRAGGFAALAVCSALLVALFFPHRLPGLLGMVAQFSIAAYLGYWVDRVCFPYARPHQMFGIERYVSMGRRAAIVSGALIGAGMSL